MLGPDCPSTVNAWVFRTAHLIGSFVGFRSKLWGEGHAFRIQPGKSLRAVGFQWRRLKAPARSRCPLFNGSIGSIATLGQGRHVGKLVIVSSVLVDVDFTAVSAAIDSRVEFVSGFPTPNGRRHAQQRYCWHAVRVLRRCRLLGAAEPCCEKVGSFMNLLWDPRAAPSPGELMDAALLHDAAVTCEGSERDDFILRVVAAELAKRGWTSSVKRPSKRPAVDGRPAQSLAADAALFAEETISCYVSVETGKTTTALRRHRRDHNAKSRPDGLTDTCLEAVRRVTPVNRPAHALPMCVAETRKRKADKTVRADCLQAWFESEEGQAWQKERNELYRVASVSAH